MAGARLDPAILAHLEWIGFVQPTGLVVSAPALVRAGAILDRRDIEGQRLLRESAEERELDPGEGPQPWLPDFRAFATSVLGWSFSAKGYAGTPESPIPAELEVALLEYGETLRPDFAVREMEPGDDETPWQLLVQVVDPGQDFDRVAAGKGQLEASPHGRMERLLRRTGVPAGLLFNGRALRLISAPRGESSGWMDFRVADMVQTAGRPICTALRLLLAQSRLLSLPRSQRLAALLQDSRKYQNEVSERLAEQVLHALYELLRGFQTAHDASQGTLLREILAEHPDEVYRSLLTVILRLVFLLYAEERGMMPDDETFVRHYSLAGLYARLREDAALFPDTMDQRFGAWAQLLVLSRLVYDGAESGTMLLPQRHGVLFDPDRFPFLEGRSSGGGRQVHERIEPPLVPDGTIYRALDKLLVLEGERISYRALDVEQIGSVYETMMGFRLQTASGRSAAIKAAKKHGAPTTIDLDALLAVEPAKRRKWIQDHADRKLTERVYREARQAATLEDLHAALAHGAYRQNHAGADSGALARRGRTADAPRADPRPQGLRPGHGLGRLPGGNIAAARRCTHGVLARSRCYSRDSPRRGRGDLRSPTHRPALSVRRRSEPGGRRPCQGLVVARDAGQGASVHLRRPCPAARRLPGRSVPRADRVLPLEGRGSALPGRTRGHASPKASRQDRRIARPDSPRRGASCGLGATPPLG